MKVYRIAKTYVISDLSGNGAKIFGGRWNQKGTGMIYASENRALATLETLVHVPLSIVPTDLSLMTLQIPDTFIPKEISIPDLPHNWRDYPAPSGIAEIGTRWAKSNASLLLRVPSVVVMHEYNILINPIHPDIKHVSVLQIETYSFEKRLLR